jgi:BASS family bile acid:Na+ symporter
MISWTMIKRGIRLNRWMEEHMLLVVGAGILMGSLFPRFFVFFKPYIPYIFAYMTFAVALSCGSSDFKKALRAPGSLLTILLCLHAVLPVLATILARQLLPGQPMLQAGIILGTAVPIGVASTIWVHLAGGNTALGLTTVVADTILSPFIVPAIMLAAIGRSVKFDVPQLMLGLALMIVLPTFIAMILHDATKGRISRTWKFFTGPTTKLFLMLVLATNIGVAWGSLHLLKSSLHMVIITVFIMSCSGYLLGFAWGRLTRRPPQLANTFIFTIGMRNITAGLVMAMKYFPELTAIPVVFAVMFQQPLAALSHRFLVQRVKGK